MNLKKKLFLSVLSASVAFSSATLSSHAEDSYSTSASCSVYSLSTTQSKSFFLMDKNGLPYSVTIEPIEYGSRMANGKYKVSLTVPNRWKAGFIVTVSSNSISSVSSGTVVPIKGSASNLRLTKISSKQAELRFTYSYLGNKNQTGVRATVTNLSIFTEKI